MRHLQTCSYYQNLKCYPLLFIKSQVKDALWKPEEKQMKDACQFFNKWISPDGRHQNQIDYILCSQRWRSSIQSAKTRPEAECGSYHELLITKFRLKLKKVEKVTRPFRYDLNQIPYDYTVKVRNTFKGLDLINGVPDELWTEVHDTVEKTGIKIIPKKKKYKKSKMAV